MMVNGVRTWVDVSIASLETDDFEQIGAAFEETRKVVVGKVANAPSKVFQVRELVDFAVPWMNANRPS